MAVALVDAAAEEHATIIEAADQRAHAERDAIGEEIAAAELELTELIAALGRVAGDLAAGDEGAAEALAEGLADAEGEWAARPEPEAEPTPEPLYVGPVFIHQPRHAETLTPTPEPLPEPVKVEAIDQADGHGWTYTGDRGPDALGSLFDVLFADQDDLSARWDRVTG